MGNWIGRLLAWLEPWLAYWLELMAGGSFLALGAAALAGVALGLSPVTYLFMPAVVGYAGAGGGASRRRAAKLSLAFVLGVTTVYVALGALWGSVGLLLLAALGSSLWLWYGLVHVQRRWQAMVYPLGHETTDLRASLERRRA